LPIEKEKRRKRRRRGEKKKRKKKKEKKRKNIQQKKQFFLLLFVISHHPDIEDLNAAIVGVSDHDLIVPLGDSHATRLIKQTISLSF